MKPPHYFLHCHSNFCLQYFILSKNNRIEIILNVIFKISIAVFILIIRKNKGTFFTGFT
jgi:hypothetical protein